MIQFPGDPTVSRIITAVLCICLEMVLFVMAMQTLKAYYIHGKSNGARMAGKFTGIILSLFSAIPITKTFLYFFPIWDSEIVSLVFIIFVVMLIGLSGSFYNSAPGLPPTPGNGGSDDSK